MIAGILTGAGTVVLFGAFAGFVLWHRPPKPLWPVLLLFQLCAVLFGLGDILTWVFPNTRVELMGIAALYTGSIWSAPIWFLLAVRLAAVEGVPFSWDHGRWIHAPFVTAFLLWLGILTNPWHEQYLIPVPGGGRNVYRWMWHFGSAHTYLLIVIAAFLFLRLRGKCRRPNARASATFAAAASMAPLIGNAAYVLWPSSPPIDFTHIGLSLGGVLLLIGVYRNRLFRLVPITLSKIIESDPDGVLLLDPRGYLQLTNPAARELLGSLQPQRGFDLWPVLARLLLRPDGLGAASDPVDIRALCEAETTPVEGELCRLATPREGWVRLYITPIRRHSGKIAAYSLRIRDVTARQQAETERERLIGELREALAEVKSLSGLLPICSSCKNIRDDRGYWQKIEGYITERSAAQFSHGICPKCAKALYPDLYRDSYPDDSDETS